ncbi:creatininase family protein [Devosia nitrariae]|uniref:Creatininase n=1 Tax=Devosia nitrariae TaxID=2071872 RepID=A0ABQ5VYS6_9HYPH|nr:creatininase family protein [Devosia nitrariae]GLQ52777.1 creatininase [Devosia nitrariae]
MATLFAEQLTATEFGAFVDAATIGVLPVAAIEPHGPHLPLSTDSDIARGHLTGLADVVREDLDVLVLPLQAIGHSIEHQGQKGLFSHSAETLLTAWDDVVAPFRLAGGRRLVIVSSHGGNSEVAALLATRLRAQYGMLAVTAAWLRFGQPEGLFEPDELAYGIHGGAVETSLMLHYRPEAVRRDRLDDFASAAREWDGESFHLKVHGRTRPGWLTRDLNAAGAVGDATAASAEKGAASARHALARFAELLEDVTAFDLKRLGDAP